MTAPDHATHPAVLEFAARQGRLPWSTGRDGGILDADGNLVLVVDPERDREDGAVLNLMVLIVGAVNALTPLDGAVPAFTSRATVEAVILNLAPAGTTPAIADPRCSSAAPAVAELSVERAEGGDRG